MRAIIRDILFDFDDEFNYLSVRNPKFRHLSLASLFWPKSEVLKSTTLDQIAGDMYSDFLMIIEKPAQPRNANAMFDSYFIGRAPGFQPFFWLFTLPPVRQNKGIYCFYGLCLRPRSPPLSGMPHCAMLSPRMSHDARYVEMHAFQNSCSLI